jgi:[acyl-carrier-protein] S-malonyltransferase
MAQRQFAMVFPGQGSQSVGMMAGYGDHPVVQQVIERASIALGQDLGALMRDGPAEDLGRTVNTQPVMVTAGYAAWCLWRELGGPVPSVVAGHSLGEYTALVVAGVLSLEQCLPIVRFRAEAMQAAVPVGTGAMAAVLGLDDDAVRAACAEAAQGEIVEAVNFNAPSQVVIAGHAAAVERAGVAAKARGAKRVVSLPVSAPFHSSLMAPAAARLAERLASEPLASPRMPVIHNVDVQQYLEAAQIRAALVGQADHPVRWTETVRAMAASGVDTLFECGPGKVLAPLARRIDDRLTGTALIDRASIEEAIRTLSEAS